MYKNSKTKWYKNRTLLTAVIIAVAGLLLFAYMRMNTGDEPARTADGNANINLEPATEAEKQETEAHKESLTNQNQVPAIDNDGKAKVTPVISNASQNEVLSFVPGILEEGGTCLATFKQGSFSFTKQSAGFKNVSTTNCEPISLTRADFAKAGTWSVTLKYDSPISAGTSGETTFEVQ